MWTKFYEFLAELQRELELKTSTEKHKDFVRSIIEALSIAVFN